MKIIGMSNLNDFKINGKITGRLSFDVFPLFAAFPELEKNVDKVNLGNFPTPIQRIKNFENSIGSFSKIYIKRDDLSSYIYGGNKVRKLEFTIGDILKKKKKIVITGGGLGSHMTIAVAAFCKKYGMSATTLLFSQYINEHVKRNLLLDKYFGAEMKHCKNYSSFIFGFVKECLIKLIKNKETPYIIIPGNSSPLGNLGYVNAAFEIKKQFHEEQIPEPDYVFVPVGSCGTMAGLLVGFKLTGMKSQIIGVRVTEKFVANERAIAKMANKTIKFISEKTSIPIKMDFKAKDIIIFHDYIGQGYGYPTQESQDIIEILKRTEGIELDPTYTSKAFACLFSFVKMSENKGKNILFINTYNSNNLLKEAKSINYKDLPKDFHQFFLNS